VAASLGLAAWLAVAASPKAFVPVLAVGLLGALGTGVALVRPTVLGPALGVSAAAYAVLLLVDDPALDARAAGVATLLVVVGELVGWSRELAAPTTDEPGNAWRRPVWIAGAGIGSLAIGAVLLAVVDVARIDGLLVETVGALAALGAIVTLLRLARAPAGSSAREE